MDKRELQFIKGAQFGWSAIDPLAPKHDVMDTWMGHRNPVRAMMFHKQRGQGLILELVNNRRLKWKVTIEVEFKDSNGKKYYRGAELVVQGVLKDSDSHYLQALEDIFAESQMKHYVKTSITAEVLGTGAIEEKDFEEVA